MHYFMNQIWKDIIIHKPEVGSDGMGVTSQLNSGACKLNTTIIYIQMHVKKLLYSLILIECVILNKPNVNFWLK